MLKEREAIVSRGSREQGSQEGQRKEKEEGRKERETCRHRCNTDRTGIHCPPLEAWIAPEN